MSDRFPGGVISKTAPVPTGPYETGTAPGIWTLDQQAEFVKQGIWPIAGLTPNYIEDVFSTWLYTGNGSTQTITNGIDLAGEGGLVWLKQRDLALDHLLMDSARGATNYLSSNTTSGQNAGAPVTFTSIGLSIASGGAFWNQSSNKYASWTFRKQPKFFDVVTWTGNGLSSQTIPHSLGAAPGCIINKSTSLTQNWWVYHRSTGTGNYLVLNTTAAQVVGTLVSATSATDFTVGSTLTSTGQTYVAYLFAHNAGGFGLSGEDNVISCGSYTGTGAAGNFVSLGYEPQWLLIKRTNTTGNWLVLDNMRGIATGGVDAGLFPNLSNAEDSANDYLSVNATGFELTGVSTTVNASGSTYIYIAIRRGPMKVPTTGTSVFGLNARTGTGANATVTGSAGVSDAVLIKNRGAAVASLFSSRLTGTGYLVTSTTAAEVAAGATILQANPWDVMDGVKVGTTSTITNASANTYINYLFDRAPGFMDVCCYTGTGSLRTVSHNLAAAPDLMIIKSRNGTRVWRVYSRALTANAELDLNSTAAVSYSATNFNNTDPTSSVFTVNTNSAVNAATDNYVAYLFASCPGVSKVGSYTGTAATLQIDCGFTTGARFVLIKRTDSTGDWYVWDSARGIVAGNDPYLLINSNAAEVTSTDYVDTAATGFEISSTAPAAINASGGTFIFLAIA